ncbi:hypothetical protein CKO28_03945 [Rhodovibrio sodomensis]|uniref:GmrSD restriction endonucleases N-terminal domain-containing protein n=1 Tax=Rhodovibrio sodomensis TaxID=1088 RepID=A0ABS1D9T8_9PROT|nr:DUF262 domain-containing protein [Rhodovibrio sodomensis]MBK1667194.1 hypothetical protein [Rhodovibrio sodomensis]
MADVKRSPRTQDISWFLDLNEKNQLDLEPPYQRRSVWSPKDKQFFIDTVLNDYPAPPIFLHKSLDEDGRPTYHVVDGKQRLETLIEFKNNRIRVPEGYGNVEIEKKKWNDLPRSVKETFWNYEIVVEMLPDVSEPYIKNIFERINRNSRRLTRQELRHAKYDGWFINFAEDQAAQPEWQQFGVVTRARSKRMADVQFICELMIVVIEGKVMGFDQDRLDDYSADYDDLEYAPETFEETEFREKFGAVKDTVKGIFDVRGEVLRDYLKIQVHFYSLWGFLVVNLENMPDVETITRLYAEFMESVGVAVERFKEGTDSENLVERGSCWDKAVAKYALSRTGASTEEPQRVDRHKALEEALLGGAIA